MSTTQVILLVALILIVALIAYAVWRNPKVRTSFSIGPIKVNLNTKRTTRRERSQQGEQAFTTASAAYPSAQIVAGEVRRSQIVNAGMGGNAEMKVGNIIGSTVVNAAGAIQLDQAQSIDMSDHTSEAR